MERKINEYNISKLVEGNHKEFKKLYNDFFNILYNLSFQYIHSKTIAEEIVQDVFLKFWEKRNTLTPDSNVKGYLYVLTRNKCLNYLRDHKLELQNSKSEEYNEAKLNFDALNELPSNYLEFEECYKRIISTIDTLPEHLKKTFLMSRMEGLKYKGIAKNENITEKAVEARISKALTILRKELKDYFPILLVAGFFLLKKSFFG